MKFEQSGLPALFYAADRSSVKSQRSYLRLFSIVLSLTVAAPVLIALAAGYAVIAQPCRYLALLSLIGSLFLTSRMKESQKERAWYGARVVAESVKTSAWRYAMSAEPFGASLQEPEAERSFLDKLSEILQDQGSLSFGGGGEANSQPQITELMRRLRSEPWRHRLAVYLEQRVNDQRDWYTKKAALSEESESFQFNLILAVQLLSVATAGAFAVWPNLRVNLAAMLTALTASLLAWLQVKRYQETSQSYALAAHELGFIAASAMHINSEGELAKFVADAESAMSREHTLWVARRQTR